MSNENPEVSHLIRKLQAQRRAIADAAAEADRILEEIAVRLLVPTPSFRRLSGGGIARRPRRSRCA